MENLQCSYCGSPNPPVVNQEGTEFYCVRCFNLFGTCAMCVHAEICPFETDPSPLPKVVVVQEQRGNMRIQQQIMNPERVNETCRKSCPCFSEEFACLKQNGTCSNYAARPVNRTDIVNDNPVETEGV